MNIDHHYMAQAIRLAEKGLYTTNPNPRVGCVLVNQNEIVGEGWHQVTGGPHAEINALTQAGDKARGATAYVTLEPCAHFGKTPPCCSALIDAGVSRVVAAMEDPNPLVAGKGMEQIAQAGIQVQSGLLEAEARALNPGFIKRMREGLPFIRAKLAMSLDGRTAMASGESKWITGSEARQDVQRLRARSSLIMTGIGTVLADDPNMTVRLPEVDITPPWRMVIDPHLSTPFDARILDQANHPTLIVTTSTDSSLIKPLECAGAEVMIVPELQGNIDLAALMQELARREINEVHLESGAILSGSMLRSGLVDEIVIYMAPKLMGNTARGLFHTPGLDRLADAVNLDIQDIRAVGDDWRITAGVKG